MKPRDAKGRFVKIPCTKRYNINDIEKAFKEGMRTSTFFSPSKQFDFYKQKEGLC